MGSRGNQWNILATILCHINICLYKTLHQHPKNGDHLKLSPKESNKQKITSQKFLFIDLSEVLVNLEMLVTK